VARSRPRGQGVRGRAAQTRHAGRVGWDVRGRTRCHAWGGVVRGAPGSVDLSVGWVQVMNSGTIYIYLRQLYAEHTLR
jgi:hypothetical protein